MKKQIVITAICFLFSAMASADTIYYCKKNGKKLISDEPCQNHGADEQKRVYTQDMPQLNTTGGLTASQVEQSRQIDQRNRQQEQANEQRRIADQQQRQFDQVQNKAICVDLENRKQNLVSQQRAPQSASGQDWLRSRREAIEAEIYRRQCETL